MFTMHQHNVSRITTGTDIIHPALKALESGKNDFNVDFRFLHCTLEFDDVKRNMF